MLERLRELLLGGRDLRWPTPSTDWDEDADEDSVIDIDHTDDDIGPEVLPKIELRPLD